jgi:rRNA processing protein Krr1/Pno1
MKSILKNKKKEFRKQKDYLVGEEARVLDVVPEPLEQSVDVKGRQRILDVVPTRGQTENQVQPKIVHL